MSVSLTRTRCPRVSREEYLPGNSSLHYQKIPQNKIDRLVVHQSNFAGTKISMSLRLRLS
ncbi:hypothetical protein [Calothrix sp. UHCC 0171]|uniref:hypothetical protein n=1 Tax=Calothrix sp. UHCC 0171 TaxID=3110245 RepID=UPI002B1E936E|nr:hypothetical protein [Calothrix sp. UHCC 0171]MEA5569485.1 hypothetical protein [Calothrix sp. UHCC 0171]